MTKPALKHLYLYLYLHLYKWEQKFEEERGERRYIINSTKPALDQLYRQFDVDDL